LNKNRQISNESPYQRILQEYLKGELRVLNAHLPCVQRPLSVLLSEKPASVVCNDGSTHLFKRKELEYLADIIDEDKQEDLLLPMIIEVNPGQEEMAVIRRGEVEEEVISKILNVTATIKQGRIVIYKPHLALLRKTLKTTTQYVFTSKVVT